MLGQQQTRYAATRRRLIALGHESKYTELTTTAHNASEHSTSLPLARLDGRLNSVECGLQLPSKPWKLSAFWSRVARSPVCTPCIPRATHRNTCTYLVHACASKPARGHTRIVAPGCRPRGENSREQTQALAHTHTAAASANPAQSVHDALRADTTSRLGSITIINGSLFVFL